MAAPQPARGLLGDEPVERGGLRVVDDRHVPAVGQLARVHLVVALPGLPLLLGEVVGSALERVVHELRRVEELLAAVDHLPLDVEADVRHEGDERVEDLGDAAAERRGGHVDDALALQRGCELADLLDEGTAHDVGVVRQRLLRGRDGLEHGRRIDRVVSRADRLSVRRSAEAGPRPLDATVHLGQDEGVQLRVPAGQDAHLVLRAGAQERPIAQGAAGRVRDNGAGLLEQEDRRREVVRRVVEDVAVADPLERRRGPTGSRR